MVGAWGASPHPSLRKAGVISVYSGADGSLIHEWAGPSAWAQLGRGLCYVDDVDGDGFADVSGGAWGASGGGGFQNGVVYIWSGATGLPIHTIWGPIDSGLFGRFMRNAGDVDADGIGDIIVGAYASSPNGLAGAGTAYVISGASGAISRVQLLGMDSAALSLLPATSITMATPTSWLDLGGPVMLA